jgi:ABC-type amino acid transport substrate-binding protein
LIFRPYRCFALLLATLLALPARAGCSRVIVAVFPLPDDGQAQSEMAAVDHRIADHAGAAIGCQIHTVQMPPPRALTEFKRGHVDIFFGLATPELEDTGSFVGDTPVGQWVLVTLRSPGTLPERLGDYPGDPSLRVGGVRGASENELLKTDIDRLRHSGQWDEAIDYETAIRKVIAGRDAVALVHSALFDGLAAHYPDAHLRAMVQDQYPVPHGGAYVSHISLSPVEQSLIGEALDRAIRDEVAQRPAAK